MNAILILATSVLAATMGPAPDKTPYRQPQLAVGDGTVAMAFASGGSVMLAMSSDQGQTFSAPVRVSESPVLAVGRHRGPHVTFAGHDMVVSAVVGKTLATGQHAHGLPADGDLVVWRSADKGKTWSKPVIVNDVSGAAREGLHALASDGHGHLAATWLDLRQSGTRLYGAFSNDGGATWSKNILVYEATGGTICQCCAPVLAATATGNFTVMFRNVVGGSRDLYTLELRDGKVASSPVKVGLGTWEINACPMDGGGMVYSEGKLVSAWRRSDEVYLTTPERPETRIGTGVDVVVAVSGGQPYVAWQKAGKVQVWSAGKTEVLQEQGGAMPSLVALPDGGVLAAWESDGGIQTRRVGETR